MQKATKNAITNAILRFVVIFSGLSFKKCDSDPRHSSVVKSSPVSFVDSGKILSIIIGFPVVDVGVKFEVYSTSVFGTFDNIMTSFQSPTTDKSPSTSSTIQMIDMKYDTCLPQGSDYGITLVALVTARNTGAPLAIVRSINLTDSVCVYLPLADGTYVVTKHFIQIESCDIYLENICLAVLTSACRIVLRYGRFELDFNPLKCF